jgi:CheY-like chemotaxis protein
MERTERLSILVVDDQEIILDLYRDYLEDKLGHNLDCVFMPGEAINMASETMYDIIICDAKITYKGSDFGGLILAEELSISCGVNAILVVSQFVDADYVRNYSGTLHFLKKPKNSEIGEVKKWFEHDLHIRIKSLLQRQYGFVAMPFGDKQLDILYYENIQKSAINAGFNIQRLDETPFTKSITLKLYQRIREAHFVVLVTTKLNPNAFYEGGYSLALGKHIITCAPRVQSLPFNIRDHRCIIYGQSKLNFTQQITDLLTKMRFYPVVKLE